MSDAKRAQSSSPSPAAKRHKDATQAPSSLPKASSQGMLVLSEADVEASLTMAEAIVINAQAFRSLHSKAANIPSRIIIDTSPGAPTLFKPGLVGSALGLKIVSVRPDNGKLGLPTVPGVVMLCDVETGLPSCVMGATYLTALRTAAGSGVATQLFAAPQAKVLTVFGAGAQGRAHVHACLSARPSLVTVHVVNRTAPRAEALVAELAEAYEHVKFDVVVSGGDAEQVAACVRESDVICTGTSAAAPLFSGKDVKACVHVNGVGSFTSQMCEVDTAFVERCVLEGAVIMDSPHAVEAGDLAGPIGKGVVDKARFFTLGGYVEEAEAGGEEKSSSRASASDLQARPTFFKSVGTAVQDLTTAYAVAQSARKKGLGTKAPL